MSITPLNSDMFGGLFGDAEIASLVDDRARLAAMLTVEAALARSQAEIGLLPSEAAEAIAVAVATLDILPGDLAADTARDGVPVPGLVKRLRAALPPQHRGSVHFGATSQDIVDTAMVLTTIAALDRLDARLARLVAQLSGLASRHARTLMAGRTRHQLASPTTFGLKLAVWAAPLARHRTRLAGLRVRLATLSLAGASGNLAALGDAGPALETRLATRLGLRPAETPWHVARDTIAETGAWLGLVCGSLGKIGQDVLVLAQNEVGEARPGVGGGSSTMPHKSNPVDAEALVSLARAAPARVATLLQAQIAESERDGAAWALEWLTLPELLVMTGAATRLAAGVIETLVVDGAAMRRRLDAAPGLLHAELAVFALARTMPRAAAEAAVAEASGSAIAEERHLVAILAERYPGAADWPALMRLDGVAETAAARVERARLAFAKE